MITYVLAVFHKIYLALEASGQARARRYLSNHNPGAWQWLLLKW
jgi:hypothetical protein